MDFKALSKNEQGVLIAGGLALIVSFIGAYARVSVDTKGDIPGVSDLSSGTNAWDSFAALGILLVVAATAVIAVKAFAAAHLPSGVPWNLVAFAASALGTLLLVVRAFTYGDDGLSVPGLDVNVGPGWSGYLLFLITIALTYFTFALFKASGDQVPDFGSKGDNPPPPPPA